MMPYITFNSLLVLLSRVTDGKNMKILPLKNGLKSLQYLKGIEVPLDLYIWRAGYSSEQGSTWNESLSRIMFNKIKSVQARTSKPFVKTIPSLNTSYGSIQFQAATSNAASAKINKQKQLAKFKSTSNISGGFIKPLLSEQLVGSLPLDNQVYGLKWANNSCSLDSMYQCLFHLYSAINVDTQVKWDNLYPRLTLTFKAIANDSTLWGPQKLEIIDLGYTFRKDYKFGDYVTNIHTHNNFFCIIIDNLRSQRFGEAKDHLLYMEQKLLSDCHSITNEKGVVYLKENVEDILKSCYLYSTNDFGNFEKTFETMQETIDSTYLQKYRWLPIAQSCHYCLHSLEKNPAGTLAKNLCNSYFTYLQDIFIIEPIQSSHCTADLKRNINFIQDEISLFHVDKDGINYIDGTRISTHKLQSIIYFSENLKHFIARFRKGENVFEYDGLKNPDANCNNRVKCIKLPAKSADFNPFSYFITSHTTPTNPSHTNSYWASFIYYVKIDILV
jgi:hypothetical protein